MTFILYCIFLEPSIVHLCRTGEGGRARDDESTHTTGLRPGRCPLQEQRQLLRQPQP